MTPGEMTWRNRVAVANLVGLAPLVPPAALPAGRPLRSGTGDMGLSEIGRRKSLIMRLQMELRIHTEHKNYVITTPDESIFSIPVSDVLLLPILNTSAERIAVYVCDEIRRRVKARFGFAFTSLEVEIEETPGQSAVYVHREEL